MKKLFLSAAVLTASIFSFSALAQQPEAVEMSETVETVTISPDNATPAQRPDVKLKGKKAHMQCDKAKAGQCSHDKKAAKGQPAARHEMQRAQKPSLFEGLNLTPEQQTALEALRPACNGADKANCDKAANAKCEKGDKAKCDKGDKAKCDKGDKAKCDKGDKGCKQQKGDRPSVEERKAKKAEFLSKVKEILTPEQYIQFLENNFHGAHH